jgi:galactose mutarotase-like enzyme
VARSGAGAEARPSTFQGWPAVVLAAGRGDAGWDVRATFLPTLGMLGVSLELGGGEVLSRHGGIDAVADGHTLGLPLLHPWANRLDGDRYRVGGTTVDLTDAPALHRDGRGLPIHGSMVGPRAWEVVELDADDERARVVATFPFGDHDDLLASFPFPHEVGISAAVDRRGLEVTTSIRPTGRRAVPVSFGWHPYLRLPGARRDQLAVAFPDRARLALDERGIPTGAERRQPAEVLPLAGRTFDDGYRVGRDALFGLAGHGRSVRVELGPGYGFAQVYAPAGKAFAALEPMTAPTNALVTGVPVSVSPGVRFAATFRITGTW